MEIKDTDFIKFVFIKKINNIIIYMRKLSRIELYL